MHEAAWSSGSGGSCTLLEGPSEVIVSNTVRALEMKFSLLSVSTRMVNLNCKKDLHKIILYDNLALFIYYNIFNNQCGTNESKVYIN